MITFCAWKKPGGTFGVLRAYVTTPFLGHPPEVEILDWEPGEYKTYSEAVRAAVRKNMGQEPPP